MKDVLLTPFEESDIELYTSFKNAVRLFHKDKCFEGITLPGDEGIFFDRKCKCLKLSVDPYIVCSHACPLDRKALESLLANPGKPASFNLTRGTQPFRFRMDTLEKITFEGAPDQVLIIRIKRQDILIISRRLSDIYRIEKILNPSE
jgi:hypothetical protein